MEVIKTDGNIQKFDIQKIRKQVEFACRHTKLNPIELESQFTLKFKNRIKTSEIQENLILTAVQNIDKDNYEWNKVAGRLAMWDIYRNVRKNTKFVPEQWREHIEYLVRNGYYRKDILDRLKNISKKTLKKVEKIILDIENKNYDFQMVFSQVSILKSKYLIKNKRGLIEYPFLSDIANALILSENDKEFLDFFKAIHFQYISLATPFKANLRRPGGNVGSCFIGEMGDNLPSIMKSYTDMSFISQQGGGIGWYLGKVRPGGTYTENTPSSNVVNKWIRIINDIAVSVNQGRNNRPGAITVALDWWHLDVFNFLIIKSELEGDLRDKAFDIFPQIVVDNYIVDKIINNEDVYLFNQYEYKKVTGKDITELVDKKLYDAIEEAQELVKAGKITGRKINAKQDLWKKILKTWIEVGDFYITHKDNLNKSNYLKYDERGGITKSANLCLTGDTEVTILVNGKEKRVKLEEMKNYVGCPIKSYNIETNQIEWQECYEFLDMGESEELIEIELEDGKVLRCTPDHKIYTKNRGYIKAEELTENDELVTEKSKVKDIKGIKKQEKIYDINVKNNHNFFANNILVHNCVESFSLSKLPTEWKEEVKNEKRKTTETDGFYHSCSLLSLSASNLVKKDKEFISHICEIAVRILDKSIDEGEMPVLEAKKSSQALRNIGIGIVGLADYLAWNKKMYNTEDGQEFGEKFVEIISYNCYKASVKLAEEKGAYPLFRPENYTHLFGYNPDELDKKSLNKYKWSELVEEIKEKGIRNFYLLALAPNTSTGIMMNATASYLPVYNIEMYQTLNDMSIPIIPRFIDERLWFYKTKFQYHPRDIVKFTRRIQNWIDTGISMEININPDIAKISEISNAILEGFKTNELKGVYYSLTINKDNKNKESSCIMCAN